MFGFQEDEGKGVESGQHKTVLPKGERSFERHTLGNLWKIV